MLERVMLLRRSSFSQSTLRERNPENCEEQSDGVVYCMVAPYPAAGTEDECSTVPSDLLPPIGPTLLMYYFIDPEGISPDSTSVL